MSSARKKSCIWSFFSLDEDTKYALCDNCKQKLSRGGATTKTYNTSNLVSHLKFKHPDLYQRFESQKAQETEEPTTSTSAKAKQISIFESSDRVRIWDINDPRAQRVHRLIGEMIAIDNQPFSVVENEGFTTLLSVLEPRYSLPSRKYMTETVLPRIMTAVTSCVKLEIANVRWYSFTTDIWSTDVSSHSLLSLTAHWLTDSFERKSAVLHAQSFPGEHTGEMICSKYKAMFEGWEIQQEQVHLIVRDNASNMVKAMREAAYPDLGCFAHTLQLIIHDGVLTQRAVIDVLANCRKIVGHFKHSPLAYCRLEEIQKSLGVPQHHLKQDEPTRWNSTLYMLQSVLEQKTALAAYGAEHAIPHLAPNQWDLIQKIVAVLNPVEEITRSISTEVASVSLIIPFIRAFRRTLEDHNNDRGIRTMKSEMLDSLNRRYGGAESNKALVLATMLDPRFKDKFFSGVHERIKAKELLDKKVAEITSTDEPRVPSPKRPKTNLLKCFADILEEAGVEVDTGNAVVDKYLAEPLIPFHRGNSLSWWAENKIRFPALAKLSQRYLSAPPTSVPSERLFSGAGEIYDPKRNRLAPEIAEMLLFIKNNLKLTGGKYAY